MKTALPTRLAALATVAFSTVSPLVPAMASTFQQQEVDQSKFVAIASPFQSGSAHQLLVVEQISNTQNCWSEKPSSSTSLTLIDPLLRNFDFTGICGRSIDSNGYSIRTAGQDLGWQYSLRIVRRNNDMVLVGAPVNKTMPELEIGHTKGLTSDFAKIELNPGWRFTKRLYDGKPTGHVYLTNDLDVAAIVNPGNGSTDPGNGTTDPGNGTTQPTVPSFKDITGDVYAKEIEGAVRVGFVSGFAEDNTFRPQVALTREQLVSMVIESLSKFPNANIQVPTSVSGRPYSDVDATRWSAAKIQWAKDNNIVSGYGDGSFRPSQAVTRAELMAVQRRTTEFAKKMLGQTADIPVKNPAFAFSDTQGHWANSLISQMSSYCSIATPVNEVGNKFAPDEQARRNYAAAATLRMMNCVKSEISATASK